MIVMKFGGTSVGSAKNIKHVSSLIEQNDEPVIAVLSAMSGTTNKLVEICNYYCGTYRWIAGEILFRDKKPVGYTVVATDDDAVRG